MGENSCLGCKKGHEWWQDMVVALMENIMGARVSRA